MVGVQVIVEMLKEKLNSLTEKEVDGIQKNMERFSMILPAIEDVLEHAEMKQFMDKEIANWLRILRDAAYVAIDGLDEWSVEAQLSQPSSLSALYLVKFKMGKRKIEESLRKFSWISDQIQKLDLSQSKSTPSKLSPRLRLCFAYCCLFPKGYLMKKDKLIGLWMANGFIPCNATMELEDIGNDIFNDLLQQFFFQDPEEDIYGNVVACKMHALMHDLASSLMVDECSSIEVNKNKTIGKKKIRHLSLICDSPPLSTILYTLFESRLSLRTLLFFQNFYLLDPCMLDFSRVTSLRALSLRGMSIETLPPSICHLKILRYLDLSKNHLISLPQFILKLRNLQWLDLSENEGIAALPPSIGDLQCLRYLNFSQCSLTSLPQSILSLTNLQTLNLSRNYSFTFLPFSLSNLQSLRCLYLYDCKLITSLPKSVGGLRNLKSLILKGCSHLEALPKTMENLGNLRHLDIKGCSKLTKMPIGIGKLLLLQTLNIFVVGRPDEDSDSSGIKELKGLDNLYGELEIQGLENVRSSEDVREASFRSKYHLTKLKLSWGDVQSFPESNSEDVLEGLQLPPNIHQLTINNYPCGTCFPQRFLENLYVLRSLQISNCKELVSFPEGLQNLTSLEELRIECCNNIESLPVMGIHGLNASLISLMIESCDNLTSVSEGLMYLTSLKTLSFQHCSKLEFSAEDFQHLTSLQHLQIGWLPKLRILPEGIQHLTMLQHLEITYCWNLKMLPKGLQCLTSLEKLIINYCPELHLEKANFQNIRSLRTLEMVFLPKLTVFPEGLQHLTKLQDLKILRCENLRMLPEGLNSLTALQSLKIGSCHQDLHKRCEKEKGEDWHFISHISGIEIDSPSKGSSISNDQPH